MAAPDSPAPERPQLDEADRRHLARALDLARQGQGAVEPNPMVGCVLVGRDGAVLGEGWHRKFGEPHAEIQALMAAKAAGQSVTGATAYVTLEPCCHTGKTPPCSEALIAAGIGRVVLGAVDPNPRVRGRGLELLKNAGIAVTVADGELAADAADLIAPFTKLVTRGRPWIIAKWAMTLDGKLAASDGSSKWISGAESRAVVQALRGRVDAVMVGRRTAELDDPLLTCRIAADQLAPRTATRIVVDSAANLSPESQLVRTARQAPVLVAASSTAPPENCRRLREAGVDVWQSVAADPGARLADLLDELGRRQMTNVLVEGGGKLLGSHFDLGEIDEVHVFTAPKLVGGAGPSPVAGRGVAEMAGALQFVRSQFTPLGPDMYFSGRVAR